MDTFSVDTTVHALNCC